MNPDAAKILDWIQDRTLTNVTTHSPEILEMLRIAVETLNFLDKQNGCKCATYCEDLDKIGAGYEPCTGYASHKALAEMREVLYPEPLRKIGL